MADIHEEIRSLTDLVDEVTRVGILLRGTRENPGLLQQLEKATLAGEAMVDRLGPVHGLTEKVEKLPARLVKLAHEETFRLGVRTAFTDLFEEVVEATRSAGIEITSRELESIIKRAAQSSSDAVFGEAAENAATVHRLQKEIENLKSQNLVLMNALSTKDDLSKEAINKMGDDLKGVSEKLASANSRRFGLSALGAAFALGIFMHGPVSSMVDSGFDTLRDMAKASAAAEKRSPW